MSRYNFQGLIFDDVILKDTESCGSLELNDWSYICKDCAKRYGFHKMGIEDGCSIDDVACDAICGVEGCGSDADYYIDFAEGTLVEVRENSDESKIS